MVVQTIHRLRERPKHERLLVARGIAGGAVVLLMAGWFIFFVRGFAVGGDDVEYTRDTSAPQTVQENASPAPAQTSSAIQASDWIASDTATTSDAPAAGLVGY